MSDEKIKWMAFLVAATFFMENLDATIITTALPAIAQSFQVSAIDLNIGISAYLIAVAIFIPISGWMADRFGAQTIFIAAIAIFTFASILCGLSPNLECFILARILQGIGGAMMVPVGRLVVLRSAPKKDLVKVIAYITWPGLVAPVLGPPLGGFIVTHFAWEWIFYLNVPLGILGILASLKLVDNFKQDNIAAFDYLGFILLAGACASVMYGMETIGQNPAHFQSSLLLAFVGLVLFVIAIRYMQHKTAPLLSFNAMKQKTFSVSIWGGSIFRIAISTIPFLLPLMFQIAFGLSAFDAGLLVLAVFAGNLVMKPFTTQIMRRFGFKKVLLVNGIIGAITIASCALFSPDTPWSVMLLLMFINGLSRSMQFTCYNSISFADIQVSDKSHASTLFSMFFQISMGMGVALAALILRGLMYAQGHQQSTLQDFHWAFIIVALFSLFSLIDCIQLKKDAGDAVSGYRPSSSA
ncbi:DHA2 family efflux MFS transporter permease subunit [Acinetobacter populi]|nr:DHA2 family efflux MFS transporter permease subunit [Acinetobacter populi]